MKLKNLTMKNFLNHANTRVDFAPVTMIFGGNDHGKSSIRDAIQYALVGLCRGVKLKKSSGSFAKDGGPDFEVSLETDAAKYTRTQTNRGAEAIPVEVAKVLTDPWKIISMDARDRQEFFTKYLSAGEEKKIDLGLEVDQTEFYQVLKLLADGNIDHAEKEAVSIRRELKRLIAACTIPDMPADTIKIGESVIDLKTVNGDYSSRYRQRQNERGILAAKLAGIGNLSEADLKENRKQKESAIAEKENAIAEIDKKLEANRLKMPGLDKKVTDGKRRINEIDGQIKAYENMIERARQSVGFCPLTAGKAKVECTQFRHPNASLVGQIEASIKDLHGQAAKLAGPLANAKGEWDRLTAENVKLHQEKELAKAGIAQAKQSISEIDASLAAIGQKDSLIQQLADIDAKIDSLKKILDAAGEWKSTYALSESRKIERAGLEKKLAQAEQVCSVLGPDGSIRANAASKAEGIKFDELAVTWGLESLKLNRDGEIILHNRPVELANKAQQYRVGVIIAQLLARKYGFLVIDEFDQLKQNFQSALMQRLPVWKDQISVVILAAVDAKPQPAKADWVKKYWVENGSVYELTGESDVAN